MSRQGRLTGLIDRELLGTRSRNFGVFQCLGTRDFDEAHWRRWARWTIDNETSCGAAKEAAEKYLRDLPALREPGQDDDEIAA